MKSSDAPNTELIFVVDFVIQSRRNISNGRPSVPVNPLFCKEKRRHPLGCRRCVGFKIEIQAHHRAVCARRVNIPYGYPRAFWQQRVRSGIQLIATSRLFELCGHPEFRAQHAGEDRMSRTSGASCRYARIPRLTACPYPNGFPSSLVAHRANGRGAAGKR